MFIFYYFSNLFLIITFFSFLIKITWFPLFFLVIVAFLGDLFLPRFKQELKVTKKKEVLYNLSLFLNLPLVILNTLLFLFLIDSNIYLTLIDKIFMILALSFSYGIGLSNVAHELGHRIWSKKSQIFSRLSLSLAMDNSYLLDHLYFHHRDVATIKDGASAQRGESFYHFFIKALKKAHVNAYHFEQLRLKGKSLFYNRLFQNYIISFLIILLISLFFNFQAICLYLLVSIISKINLEIIDYIEHYGLIREEGAIIQNKHSWNSNHTISSFLLYNLTRHSSHHTTNIKPYWQLKDEPLSPNLPFGYLTMLFLALIPPVFKKVIEKPLKQWDENLASPEELLLIKKINN